MYQINHVVIPNAERLTCIILYKLLNKICLSGTQMCLNIKDIPYAERLNIFDIPYECFAPPPLVELTLV
jgi:hypothetical protein